MRTKYWVLYNYIRAARQFNCAETITYTTHGQFTFLDNLEPLLERWRGPISVAVYAPGSDLQDTIDTILYFRCKEKISLRWSFELAIACQFVIFLILEIAVKVGW